MKNKCLTEEQIARYIDGLASETEQQLIIRHIRECKKCANEIAAIFKFHAVQDFKSDSAISKDSSFEKPSSAQDENDGITRSNNMGNSIPLFSGGFLSMDTNTFHNHSMPMVAGIDENHESHDRNTHLHDSDILHDNTNNSENHNNIMATQINRAPNQFGEEAKIDVSSQVFQGYSDTCAIRSQQLVLNDFGIPVTQEDLIHEATQNGWYSEGSGTPMTDVGNLLENHGISVHRLADANIYNLTNELAQGHKVIIGVDANELWHDGVLQNIKDSITGETPNHALIVAGIDTSDPDNIQVILTDPGTGDVAKAYPIDQFMDAWHDSDNFMVSTDNPAPLEHNPEMINFDYTAGHLSSIGQMPYEYFDQTIYPLSQYIENDPIARNQLHHDFVEMVNGSAPELSPELEELWSQAPSQTTYHTDNDTDSYYVDLGNEQDDPNESNWMEQHDPFDHNQADHDDPDYGFDHTHDLDDLDHITDEF